MKDTRNEIRFEIIEHIGILEQHQTGWNKELNVVSWNGNPVSYTHLTLPTTPYV